MAISPIVIDKSKITGTVAFIVNHYAGGGSCKKTWREKLYPRVVEEFGERVPIFVTRGSGDATNIARQLVEMGIKRIGIVGGDGTLHEVLQGYMEAKGAQNQVSLHIFPAGTGNDFHDYIHPKCHSAENCLELFINNRVELHDVGYIQYKTPENTDGQRFFMNFASIGLSAVVVKYLSTHKKSPIVPRRHVYSTYSFFLSQKHTPIPVSITMTDEIQCPNGREKVLLYQKTHNDEHLSSTGEESNNPTMNFEAYELVIGNGPRSGGGLLMTPNANSRDQLLDISVFHKATTWNFIKDYPSVSKGTVLERNEKYFGFKCRGNVHLTPSMVSNDDVAEKDKIPVQSDGEFLGFLPATISLIPSSIQFTD